LYFVARNGVVSMPEHTIKKTQVGIELVRVLASEGYRIFTSKTAREFSERAGIKEEYLLESLFHLRVNGWITSIRRGLYAITSAVPGLAAAHEFEIAMALASPAAISHWSALHYHGLTEQAPHRVFVLTTTDVSIPRVRNNNKDHSEPGYQVGDTIYQFIQVKPTRYFGTQNVWIGDARVTITDPERTLLDGLTMPKRCGDFAEVLHAFENHRNELRIERIVGYALKSDKSVAKRLGWVLDHLGMGDKSPALMEVLTKIPTTGYCILDPEGPRKGPRNRRWMIQENLPGKV
jgi:predicted transcriptional regulator of viral defense system